MRKLLLFFCAVLVLVPITAFSQGSVYAHFMGGTVFMKGEKSQFSLVTSGDIPIARDTAKSYIITERAGYFYGSRADQSDIKAAYSMICGTKYFDIGKTTLNFTLGSGALIEAQDGGKTLPAFKGELGLTLYKTITFSLGTDYMAVDGETDRVFFYAGLDLLP